MRDRLVAERGLMDVIYPTELSPKKMAGKLVENLQRRNQPSYDPAISTNVFFFQAEDGIEVVAVTGVQTCALPISRRPGAGRASRTGFPPGPGAPGTLRRGWARSRPG